MQAAQVAVAAEPAAEGEGEAAPEFSLEEDLDELLAVDGLPADLPVAGQPPQDRLQMLIEDLSGISGALREAPPPAAEEAVLPEGKAWTLEPGARIVVAAAPADPAPVIPIQAEAVVSQADLLLADPAPLPSAHALRDIPVASTDQPPPRVPVVSVARQIAEAVVTTREDRIEVALAPEELGRIRLVMSGPEHSPHVLVWAERPEVLDQLRRNTMILQECFGDAGMADASFEFQGDGSAGSGGRQPTPDAAPQGFAATESVPVAVPWTPMVIPARLDIRI